MSVVEATRVERITGPEYFMERPLAAQMQIERARLDSILATAQSFLPQSRKDGVITTVAYGLEAQSGTPIDDLPKVLKTATIAPLDSGTFFAIVSVENLVKKYVETETPAIENPKDLDLDVTTSYQQMVKRLQSLTNEQFPQLIARFESSSREKEFFKLDLLSIVSQFGGVEFNGSKITLDQLSYEALLTIVSNRLNILAFVDLPLPSSTQQLLKASDTVINQHQSQLNIAQDTYRHLPTTVQIAFAKEHGIDLNQVDLHAFANPSIQRVLTIDLRQQATYISTVEQLGEDMKLAFMRLLDLDANDFQPDEFTKLSQRDFITNFIHSHPTPEAFWPAMNRELHQAQIQRETDRAAARRRGKEQPQIALTEQVISATERLAVRSEVGARTINEILAQYGMPDRDAFSLQAVYGNEKQLPSELLDALRTVVGELPTQKQTGESWAMRLIRRLASNPLANLNKPRRLSDSERERLAT